MTPTQVFSHTTLSRAGDDKGLVGLQEGVTEGQMNEKAADSRLI